MIVGVAFLPSLLGLAQHQDMRLMEVAMRAIMVMFDSLNRRMLPAYGCDWVHAPNFQRLAQRTVVFDNSYVGSMPCMPARRELHTGRYNSCIAVGDPWSLSPSARAVGL